MNIFVVICILPIVELLKCWRKKRTTYRDDKWLLIKNKNLLILKKRLLFTARPGLKEIHFFVKLLVWLGQYETGGDVGALVAHTVEHGCQGVNTHYHRDGLGRHANHWEQIGHTDDAATGYGRFGIGAKLINNVEPANGRKGFRGFLTLYDIWNLVVSEINATFALTKYEH